MNNNNDKAGGPARKLSSDQMHAEQSADNGASMRAPNADSSRRVPEASASMISEPPTAQIWQSTLRSMRSFVTASVYDRYLGTLTLLAEVEGEVLIVAPGAFEARRVETDYLDRLKLIWRGIDPRKRRLVLREVSQVDPDVMALAKNGRIGPETSASGHAQPVNVSASGTQAHQDGPDKPAATSDASPATSGPRAMTLENFAVGDSNRSAFAIASKVAANGRLPGQIVMICGISGVGKTHLLRAIYHARVQAAGDAGATYMNAQAFFSEYVEGVRARNTRTMESRLASASLLLLDDLHWLAGRPGTQDQFFQLLRETVERGHTVIMSADRVPSELDSLTPKLRAELRCALTVEITEPDEALRLEIARLKVADAQVEAPDFVANEQALERLSRQPCTGRDIAGIVANLALNCGLMGRAMSDALIDEIVRRQLGERKEPSMDAIRAAVAHQSGVSKADMDGPRKLQPLVNARHKAMFLCKKLTTKSLPQIGKRFGGRDHTTVMHAVSKMEALLSTSPSVAAEIASLERLVLSGRMDSVRD